MKCQTGYQKRMQTFVKAFYSGNGIGGTVKEKMEAAWGVADVCVHNADFKESFENIAAYYFQIHKRKMDEYYQKLMK